MLLRLILRKRDGFAAVSQILPTCILRKYPSESGEDEMPKEAVFTMKLEPELRTTFMAAAADRPASQILREMMRGYIQQQRESRQYEAFLRAKVTAARKSVESGQGHSDAEVEAEFSARRERAFRPE